jgi:hypothetical protein
MHLFLWRDVQEDLHHSRVVLQQHPLEVVDLVIGTVPFRRCCIRLDTLDQDTAVPRAVEYDNLTVLRQAFPKAL